MVALTKVVEVTDDELMHWFAYAMWKRSIKTGTMTNVTYWRALSHLVGITDKEAVAIANDIGGEHQRITVTKFRKWLPETLSRFAKDVIGNDD